jgi:hypothetical protein
MPLSGRFEGALYVKASESDDDRRAVELLMCLGLE